MPSKLVEFEIARPAIFGVNSSASGDVMPKEYAVQANNVVFNDEGVAECRRGSQKQHSTPLTDYPIVGEFATDQTVRQIFNTVDQAGADITIFSTEDGIFKSKGSSIENITGTITAPSAGNWKFVNLNNEVLGFQAGNVACKLTDVGGGEFEDFVLTGTPASAPINTTTNVIQDVLSAFGRLWVLEGDELHYSSTLVPEDFRTSDENNSSDGGTFTLNATYLNGKAKPVAIREFNGNLLVMCEDHITVWANPWNPNDSGANYGGNTSTVVTYTAPMQVLETIGGVGCIARDSIQDTQNDIVFLSEQGVTSLSRVIQEKSMPIKRHSDNMRQEVLELIRSSNSSKNIWSAYLPAKGNYLFGSPVLGKCFLLDLSAPLPDNTYRMATWDKVLTTMDASPQSRLGTGDDVWEALWISEDVNYISKMGGFNDGSSTGTADGTSYLMTFESAWTSILEEFENNIKMPKRMGVVIKGSGSQSFSMNLAFDYGDYVGSRAKTGTSVLSNPSTYVDFNYGGVTIDEDTAYYGTATNIKLSTLSGYGKGRILKIKVTSTIDGNVVSLQRISINCKVGRRL